ncbi:MAG: ABC transporter substrate-binding protein, partial [Burkholderiales bacterium]
MRVFKLVLIAVIAFASASAAAQGLEKRRITIAVGGKSLLYYLPLTIADS